VCHEREADSDALAGTEFALLVLALLWPVTVRADFQAGLDAYDRGDYKTAYREWLLLAEQGNDRTE